MEGDDKSGSQAYFLKNERFEANLALFGAVSPIPLQSEGVCRTVSPLLPEPEGACRMEDPISPEREGVCGMEDPPPGCDSSRKRWEGRLQMSALSGWGLLLFGRLGISIEGMSRPGRSSESELSALSTLP